MIAYLKGKLTYKSPTTLFVEAANVGYHVNISLYTYERVEKLDECKIFIHHHITESDQSLFGFFDEEEKSIFKHLISVSGVGPSTARMACSYMAPSELRLAIVQENVQAVNKIKGIGPKTAKRLILDLKDKLFKEMDEDPGIVSTASSSLKEETLSALVALGFSKAKVSQSVDKLIKEQGPEGTVESLIKAALRQLS